jgi:hypothetical protein
MEVHGWPPAKILKLKSVRGVTQMMEYLPTNHEALSFQTPIPKKKTLIFINYSQALLKKGTHSEKCVIK